jgi:hypothetical protein
MKIDLKNIKSPMGFTLYPDILPSFKILPPTSQRFRATYRISDFIKDAISEEIKG